jgi:hypothetical protein
MCFVIGAFRHADDTLWVSTGHKERLMHVQGPIELKRVYVLKPQMKKAGGKLFSPAASMV